MQRVNFKTFNAVINASGLSGGEFIAFGKAGDVLVTLEHVDKVEASCYLLYVYGYIKPEGWFAQFRKPVMMQDCIDVFTKKSVAQAAFDDVLGFYLTSK